MREIVNAKKSKYTEDNYWTDYSTLSIQFIGKVF